MAWDVERIVSGIVGGTAAIVVFGQKALDYWDRRHPEAAKRRASALAEQQETLAISREQEAQGIDAARFYREDGVELRKQISQLRLDFDNERVALHKEIATLTKTNEQQAREILSLKGQIFDLQKDRARQATEGKRQTDEGIRQTDEGVRQTNEGERLLRMKKEMEDEQ